MQERELEFPRLDHDIAPAPATPRDPDHFSLPRSVDGSPRLVGDVEALVELASVRDRVLPIAVLRRNPPFCRTGRDEPKEPQEDYDLHKEGTPLA